MQGLRLEIPQFNIWKFFECSGMARDRRIDSGRAWLLVNG